MKANRETECTIVHLQSNVTVNIMTEYMEVPSQMSLQL